MLPIDYLPGARRDFDESFDWYADRSTQAAVRFAAAMEAALARVSSDPTQFASRDGVHRECPVKKFPFRIVYRLDDHRVLVVAVVHAKRRPEYWHKRA
jgi:plasmid stabilization system protein ParE